MQTYLFYDIESTGLNKAFDQVLHFAAIRTDLHLKEIKRYELKIKLNPDVIPSPYALLTHKMGIKEISQGITEFDAIAQIHQWLNEPGTISLGYNTLGFDDEFLRFSFYRNLLKPYTHQYHNQCSRMDIYPMTIMFFLFKKNVLTWPEKEGMPSFKLENLNAANQFVSGRAHHAMIDVEITLELARRFFREREMWDHLSSYFKKEFDKERMRSLQSEMALLINPKIGSKYAFQSPVLFLGNHQHYQNQSLWLRLDTEDFTQTTADNLTETLRVIHKKPGEPNFILPIKERFMTELHSDRLTLAEQNKAWLHTQPDLFAKIKAHYLHYTYPTYPNTDIEASLYLNGFWSPAEELFCQRFHMANPVERALLLEHPHSKLHALALRILGKNYPETLTPQQTQQFQDYLHHIHSNHEDHVPIDYQGRKRLTPYAAIEEVKQLRRETHFTEEDLKLLNEFEDYLLSFRRLEG